MDKILGIVKEIKSDIDYEKEKKLIDDELLDSFDVVAIIGDLSDEFGISISVDEMIPENFNSIEAIHEMVLRLEEEQK